MEQYYINLIDGLCQALEDKANIGVDNSYKTYFWFKINRSYTKILMVDGFNKTETTHAFIDNKTFNLYKPLSDHQPDKKTVKFNLISDFNYLLDICEWTGGYLYKYGVKKVKKIKV